MKGNDTKRQILLSYYESDNPVEQITMTRTKQKPFKENDNNKNTLNRKRGKLKMLKNRYINFIR